MTQKAELVDMTAEIVSAYVGHNNISPNDLPDLISKVYAALSGTYDEQASAPVLKADPAVPVRKSITPDYLICLEDGKKFKSLKRHLWAHYSLTPDEYREKWGLPSDYPMVAPNYATARSQLAKKMGLGQVQKKGRRSKGK